MIKNILLTVILFLVSAAPSWAGETTVTRGKSHLTLFVNLQRGNASSSVAEYVNRKLAKELNKIPYCTIVTDRELNKHLAKNEDWDYTYYRYYGLTQGKLLSTHRTIAGTIDRIKKKYYTEKGQSGKNQYILQRHKEDYLTISLEVFDMADETLLAEIEEQAQPDKKSLDRALASIIAQVARLYGPRIVTETREKLEISLSGAGAFLVTEGPFQDFSQYGYGFATGLTLTNIFVRGLSAQIYLGYYYLDEKKLQLDSLHTFFATYLMGYSFRVHENVRIAPYLGFGYHMHLAEEYTGSMETFFDPFFTIQCEFSFRFLTKYSLFVTPSYTIFFEQDNMGRYFSLYAGFRYSWFK